MAPRYVDHFLESYTGIAGTIDKGREGAIQGGTYIEEKLFSKPIAELSESVARSKKMGMAWQYIQMNYLDQSINLQSAARYCGVEKNHLNDLLRRATGLTFHQLLVRYRLLRAVIAMSTTKCSLTEVAWQNGFNTIGTFERNFQRLIGMTPRAFRLSPSTSASASAQA